MPEDVKGAINEEGWESDGAAVLIGKESEMPRLREKLEKEGRAVDVASYIRMHKEIAVPADEVEKIAADALKPGMYFIDMATVPERTLYYIDSEKNIARVRVDVFKIDSLMAGPKDFSRQLIDKELADSGFKNPGCVTVGGIEERIESVIWKSLDKHRKIVEEAESGRKEREFDF